MTSDCYGTLATWLDYLILAHRLSLANDPTADHTSGHAIIELVLFGFPLLSRGLEKGVEEDASLKSINSEF